MEKAYFITDFTNDKNQTVAIEYAQNGKAAIRQYLKGMAIYDSKFDEWKKVCGSWQVKTVYGQVLRATD